jgi:hypothetical protein
VGCMGEVVANCSEPGQGASKVTKGDLTLALLTQEVALVILVALRALLVFLSSC